ncbi:hypothetical protein BD289DRAFT_425550 [Coniella lustricola]|uniref:Distal membrane-arm assembly complex protein 1-like domain-containing protein n=1 Tax=Coniella lustricola TaxID=2025994 RepID=A0A2T3AHM2_9PEZI|nr:hypothetical protein BD289DRAFT_425550 [Coniella lustricola]
MAGGDATLHNLQAPVKAEELLKQERREHDCTSCRLVGGTAFIGLAGYTYWEGTRQLERNRALIVKSKSWLGMRGRKIGLVGTSIGLGYMGLYRLFA